MTDVLMVTVGEVQGIAEVVARAHRAAELKLRDLANYIGIRTVEYLKSLTGEMRPPARKANGAWTGWRKAHPGHWADVTGILVGSYSYQVQVQPGLVTLELRNSAAYAAFLDLRVGFFVLRGVTDPGGPVERALEVAVATVAPDWVLTRAPRARPA